MKLKTWLGILTAVVAVFTVQAQDMSDEAIKERIKPLGTVHIAGAEAQAAAGAGAGGAKSGEDVYNQACMACHGAGVLGAPKLQVAADWQPRIDARGLDGIWQNALNGINAMPPRGACGNCSDDEIKAAIEYMVEGI
ncbi:c-type cytochrome [Alteromonas ponticola]|uniref:C-type cytochrome n=1 Tax=Alteromonas aquimaris TaxID=2998417 RepID=A0ABT3PAX3_9ALTE|nr:c-type cytochrome [Alteromonas aquimaris]MCW8109931.1 c-type cytochrome [Alteromonas aquimaris]